MSLSAIVSNISKCSVHDGPGVRTVVYLKGCNMRCKWCHNPETLSKFPEILYADVKCIHCGRCIDICPECHVVSDGHMKFERDKCKKCGKCADVCPTGAISICGEEKNSDEVFVEIMKDKHYYNQSGGGITVSGGECLLYPDFTAELLKKCKNENIHTTIETALFVPWENVKKIIEVTDLVYADLKIPDDEKHREYTGQSNKLIIDNLKKLSENHNNIIIRIPLIPGVNDSVDDMKKFRKIIESLHNIKDVELLKYNYLASSKYHICGRPYHDFGTETQSDETINTLKRYLW